MISLDPENLEEVFADLIRLAVGDGQPAARRALLKQLRGRLAAVGQAVAGADRPRVAALEWLDPVYVGGHWVPEMIAAAGGTDALGEAGRQLARRSTGTRWGGRPEVVVAMPCGLYAAEAAAQARDHADRLRGLGASGSSPSTPPPRSRARAPAWSTASSCSPTSSTPTSSRRRADTFERDMGVHSAEQSVEIDAPPEACFDAASTTRRFPAGRRRWSGPRCWSATRRAGRRGAVRGRREGERISYTLRYHYDAPGRIWWEFVEGDGVAASRATT